MSKWAPTIILVCGNTRVPKFHRRVCSHVYHLYVIDVDCRDALVDYLWSKGVMVGIHYPVAVHQMPAFAEYFKGVLPQTERIVHRILSLPIYPELLQADQELVINHLKGFFVK